MATLVKLDYSGKDINVYVPPLGDWPRMSLTLNYDKDNFVFSVKRNGKKICNITAKEVINNIEGGFYKINQHEK